MRITDNPFPHASKIILSIVGHHEYSSYRRYFATSLFEWRLALKELAWLLLRL